MLLHCSPKTITRRNAIKNRPDFYRPVCLRYRAYIHFTREYMYQNSARRLRKASSSISLQRAIKGYADGSFKPELPISRAEVVTMANRVLERVADKSFIAAHQDMLKQGSNNFINARSALLKTYSDVSSAFWAYYDILEATNAHTFTRTESGDETWTQLN